MDWIEKNHLPVSNPSRTKKCLCECSEWLWLSVISNEAVTRFDAIERNIGQMLVEYWGRVCLRVSYTVYSQALHVSMLEMWAFSHFLCKLFGQTTLGMTHPWPLPPDFWSDQQPGKKQLQLLLLWCSSLNGQKLQDFVENPQTMSCICAVCRKFVHSLHFFMNCCLLFFTSHFLPSIFRLRASGMLSGPNMRIAALKLFKWIHFCSEPAILVGNLTIFSAASGER